MNCRVCVFHPATIGRFCKHCYYIKHRFNVDPRDIQQLRAAQVDYCAICGKHVRLNNKRELAIDYDRETGEIRGLLCTSCNLGLGHLKTEKVLQATIDYLRRPRPGIKRLPVKHRSPDEENYLSQVFFDSAITSLNKKGEKLASLIPGLSKHGAISRLRRYKEWVEEKDEYGEETFSLTIPLDNQQEV